MTPTSPPATMAPRRTERCFSMGRLLAWRSCVAADELGVVGDRRGDIDSWHRHRHGLAEVRQLEPEPDAGLVVAVHRLLEAEADLPRPALGVEPRFCVLEDGGGHAVAMEDPVDRLLVVVRQREVRLLAV